MNIGYVPAPVLLKYRQKVADTRRNSDASDDEEHFKPEKFNDASDCDESPSKKKAKGAAQVKVEHDEENGFGDGAAPFGVEDLEEGTYA